MTEDNGDAHLKRQVMGREVVVAVTEGRLDFGPWEQIFYGSLTGGDLKDSLLKLLENNFTRRTFVSTETSDRSDWRNQATPENYQVAYELGTHIANRGAVLVVCVTYRQ